MAGIENNRGQRNAPSGESEVRRTSGLVLVIKPTDSDKLIGEGRVRLSGQQELSGLGLDLGIFVSRDQSQDMIQFKALFSSTKVKDQPSSENRIDPKVIERFLEETYYSNNIATHRLPSSIVHTVIVDSKPEFYFVVGTAGDRISINSVRDKAELPNQKGQFTDLLSGIVGKLYESKEREMPPLTLELEEVQVVPEPGSMSQVPSN